MPTPTLDDLLETESEDFITTYFLTQLGLQGFPVTAWQPGNPLLTLLRILATALAGAMKTTSAIASGGFLSLATKGWLTLLAKSAYGLDRLLAQSCVQVVRVTCAGGSGPYTITPGQLWVVDPSGAYRFNSTNPSNVVLGSGSFIDIAFRAEQAGSAYNLPLATVLALSTPLPGVTVAFQDQGSGSAITTAGTDDETDAALQARCASRWATIGLQKIADAYAALAIDPASGASTVPNRVYVDDTNPRGAGTVNVWVAGPSGALSGADLSAVSAYVLARKSVCADVQVANATAVAINVTADLYYQAAYTNAVAVAQDNLTTYINGVAMGGTVSLAELYACFTSVAGVTNAIISVPGADLTLTATQVAIPGTFTITGHAV